MGRRERHRLKEQKRGRRGMVKEGMKKILKESGESKGKNERGGREEGK